MAISQGYLSQDLKDHDKKKIIKFYNDGMSADEIEIATGFDSEVISDLITAHLGKNPCGALHGIEDENCMRCKIIKKQL